MGATYSLPMAAANVNPGWPTPAAMPVSASNRLAWWIGSLWFASALAYAVSGQSAVAIALGFACLIAAIVGVVMKESKTGVVLGWIVIILNIVTFLVALNYQRALSEEQRALSEEQQQLDRGLPPPPR